MTNDTARTTDQIERDIARERSEMSDTLTDLQEKFSLDAIVNDIGGMVRDHGGDLARSARTAVARNPGAIALVGVGVAWLLLGPMGQRSSTETSRQSAGDRTRGSFRPGTGDRNPRTLPEGRAMTGATAVGTGTMSGDEDRAWYDRPVPGDRGYRGPGTAPANGHAKDGIGARHRGVRSMANAVSGGASSVGETAGGATEWLSDGLEALSEDARTRVMSARRAALDARQSSEEALRLGSRRAAAFFEDQPLVVGAIALAFGAALGSVLPHSRREDDAMGESSDRLLAEAQAVFLEERDRATAAVKESVRDVADEVAKDIRDAGSDLRDQLPEGKSVADTIADRAADAGGRIADSATGKRD